MSDRTEEPTPRRLRRAREEGDAGVSSHATQAVGFVVAVAVAPAAVRALAGRAAGELRGAIAAAGAASLPPFDPLALATSVLSLCLPLLAAAGIASGVVAAVQAGGVLAPGRLAPRLDRLDPVAGLRNLLSGARLFAVARALVAAPLVAWLAVRGIQEHLPDLARVAGRPAGLAVVIAEVAGTLAWRAALLGLGLGALDLLVTRVAWKARLRMSKDEVRREHKDSDGDPHLKAARARAAQEMLAEATIASVRTASVVVVNPTHLACALRYDDAGGDEAPVVVASGQGELAARIRAAAEAWGIPVVRDVPLARALVELRVGDTIPEALYEAVAEILREVWEGEPGAPG